jgi:hypothetical protein
MDSTVTIEFPIPGSKEREVIKVQNTDSFTKVITDTRIKDFSCDHFAGQIYDDGSVPAPKTIGILGAIRDIITCKFLVYGDTARDIRGQMVNEQLNIALVSALFLTVSIPAMLWSTELYQHGWTKTESSIFGLSLCIATANFAIAVVFAVFFSLGIQECIDDGELRRFTQKMGRLLQLSSVSFIVGVITIGMFSWTMWCYVTFASQWFWGIFSGCIVVNTFMAAFSGLIIMIKNLYAAKEGRHGLLIVCRAELGKAVKAHMQTLPSSNVCTLESITEFMLRESGCIGLTEITSLGLRSVWKQELRRVIQEEYEDSSTDEDHPSSPT